MAHASRNLIATWSDTLNDTLIVMRDYVPRGGRTTDIPPLGGMRSKDEALTGDACSRRLRAKRPRQ